MTSPSTEHPSFDALRATAIEWLKGGGAVAAGLLVPGLGHLFVGRARRGLLWFGAIVILVNWQMTSALTNTAAPLPAPLPGVQSASDWALSTLLPTEYMGFIGTVAPLWLIAFLDVVLCVAVPLVPAWRRFRETRLRDAAAHVVRGEHPEALRELARIRFVDRSDPAACLWTALTLRLAGRPRDALRYASRPLASRCDATFKRTFRPALLHEVDVIVAEIQFDEKNANAASQR